MIGLGIRRFLVCFWVTVFTLALICHPPLITLSAADQLDPSFDKDGKLLTALGSENVHAQAVLMQTDQKLVVAGSVLAGEDWDFILLRYCPNGKLDDGVNCGTPGFGTGGRVVTDFGGGLDDTAMDAVIQPDGKIVVAGTSALYPQFDMALARYDTNGNLDGTFDTDGMMRVDFGDDERGYAVALQPDGKIIVGGVSYYATWGDFALARVCPNGGLDDGTRCGVVQFGSGGMVITDFAGSSDWVDGLAVHEGKIIAGGSGGNKDFAVARYNESGSLDTAFGVNGKATASFGSGWDYGQDVLVQSDGKIIVAGGGYAADWNTDFGIVRFTTTGILDTSFDGDGKVLTEFNGYSDRILSVTLQGDQILAAGYATHCYGSDLAVVRYQANGSLDTTFDTDGKLTTDFGAYHDSANSIAVQADGRIVAAGYTGEQPNGTEIALVRYNTNGSLDAAMGADGKVLTAFGGGYNLGYSVAVADGKILSAGWLNNTQSHDFAVARFLIDGSLDTSFAGNGVAVVDFNGGDDQAYAMVVLADGKVVLAGTTLQGSASDFALARLCADGRLDNGVNCGSPGFATGGKIITDFGGQEGAAALLLQPDGDLVAVGSTHTCPNSDMAVARLNADGKLDNGFSGDGKTTVDFSGYWDEARGVALHPDGNLIVVGYSNVANVNQDFALASLCPNGTLDDGVNCGSPAFGSGGRVTSDLSGSYDRAAAVAVQADGKLLAAGYSSGSSADFAVVRYCADGMLDDGVNCGNPAFGTAGKTTTDFWGDWDEIAALRLLPDGKILVGGYASYEVDTGWDEDFALALYDSNGVLFTGFSSDGRETIDFGAMDEQGFALALQPEGKFIVSGSSSRFLAMARLIYELPIRLYVPVILR
ncbi:MAG: hypothetical protein MUC85_06300 [Anaerolineales bacterium]|jgi:uncharacterized delta-60 repeat protein|nr:hypothetical protein [Anaerolineales bacterium]